MDTQQTIAFFVPSLRGAGAERVDLNLVRAFVTKGYAVDLVVLKREGAFADVDMQGIRIVDLASPRALVALPALIRYIQREHPATLVSALPHMNILALMARSIARARVKIVITEHNPFSSDFAKGNPLKRMALIACMRILYPRADTIVAVSRGVAGDIARVAGVGVEKIRVIYNPIVAPEIKELARAQANHPWVDEKQGPVVLAAGRLTKQKDFPTLVKAFAHAREATNARLIILGEGEERDALERLVADLDIQESVSLPGFVENPYAFMARADVFVLSSLWEGFGNVLVEAMACRTPVVATRCPGGIAEVLAEGEYGTLITPGDVPAMARGIEEALRNPGDLDRLVARANEFSVERIANEYEGIVKPNRRISVVTFADIGSRHNLKTPGIVPVLRTLAGADELGQVVCRIGAGSPFPTTISAIGILGHYAIKALDVFLPNFSSRALEEWVFDMIASARLKQADAVLFHPEFAFPKTIEKAKRNGALAIGIATVVHPALNEQLAREEYALVPGGTSLTRVGERFLQRAEVVNSFDYIIALSELVKTSYVSAGFPKERISVAHPDIDGATFVPQEKKDDVFRALYIAHTTVLKGLHYLLEAWNDADLAGAELVIVGGYSAGTPRALREWYSRMIEGKSSIRWVGETKTPEAFYAEASLVVFPSLTEGFGRVTLEAMTAGLPVIATENARGIIEDGVSGFIVPIRDTRAIREKIEVLYNDSELRKRMGQDARIAAEQKKPFGDAVYEICNAVLQKERS